MTKAVHKSSSECRILPKLNSERKEESKNPHQADVVENRGKLLSLLVIRTLAKQRLCFLKLKLRHLKIKSDHSAGPKLAKNMSENKRVNMSGPNPALLHSFSKQHKKIADGSKILLGLFCSQCLSPAFEAIRIHFQAESTRRILMRTISHIEEKREKELNQKSGQKVITLPE